MRIVLLAGTLLLPLALGLPATAEEPADEAPITTEEALDVPTDVDDADDIADDDNPDDPGQAAVDDPVDDWPNPGAEGERLP